MSSKRQLVTVAPREIKDLVFRCCKVSLIDAGTAAKIAGNIVHSEIFYGGAVNWFCGVPQSQQAAQTGIQTWTASLPRMPKAQSVVVIRLEDKVPMFAVALEAYELACRGTLCANYFELDESSNTIKMTRPGQGTLTELRFSAIPDSASSVALQGLGDWYAEKKQNAFVQGLNVEPIAFEKLTNMASGYLVSESLVDAATLP